MEYDEQEDQPSQDQDNSVIRELRKEADEAKKLRKELEDLRAKQAVSERRQALGDLMGQVGVQDTDREKFSRLADKFIEGDLDEAKVRDLATEYGFLASPGEAAQEAQALEQVAQAHRGASLPPMGRDKAEQDLRSVRDRAYAGDRNLTQREILQAISEAGLEFGGQTDGVIHPG